MHSFVYAKTFTQINEDEFPPPSTVTPYPEATQITVGDAYYGLSKWLPAGAYYLVSKFVAKVNSPLYT